MNCGRIVHTVALFGAIITILVLSGCNATRHLKEGQYLLRSNSVKLKATTPISQKATLRDNLGKLAAQKPNSYSFNIYPSKLYRYNSKYSRYLRDNTNTKLKVKIDEKVRDKKIEPPVIFDSTLLKKSLLNMKSYMFNKGFFYATIDDTIKLKGKKARVTYDVETGINYLIHYVRYDVDDSAAHSLIVNEFEQTFLKYGVAFSYDLLDQEKTRITNILRDWGYWKFTNENISFELDTVTKDRIEDVDNTLGHTLNLLTLQEQQKKKTIDIKVIIRSEDSTRDIYRRYGITSMTVYPDYKSGRDLRDTTMLERNYMGVKFKYHKYNVREKVIVNHMVAAVGRYYSQSEHDITISKLNDLGIFQSVRISYTPDGESNWLKSNVMLTPSDKYFYSTSWELSNGTTYLAGTNLTLSLLNRNVGKGANLLTTTLTGGIESFFDSSTKSIELLSKSIGLNTSLEFPKFLFPISQSKQSSLNAPRTVINLGASLLERINYFNLYNISTSFAYKWKETKTKSWEVSPAFINFVLPDKIDKNFQKILDSNDLLRNTYSRTFIEGENVAFTYSDKEQKNGRNYNYLRVGFEEAGGIMKGLNLIFDSLRNKDFTYAQYLKFDVDAQKFFNRRHSAFAFRFQTGIGIPYDLATTLPYIKQYFVGGAYSLRGFRIRTLGPGSYKPTTTTSAVIDRTGDLKLELTGEYRFDLVQLFSGSIKLKGALFGDIGNIWLYKRDDVSYPNAHFAFNKLGDDLAIDAGLGLRVDVGFFVVRFDMGMPVKTPNYNHDDTNGWIVKDLNLLWPQVFKNDWVLNFAIGYPF